MDYTRNEDKLGCKQYTTRIIDIDVEEASGVTEPVTLDEVKDHLRITFSDDDNILDLYIKMARAALERYTGISFVEKEIRAIIEHEGTFELPYGPVQEITEAKDINGDELDVDDVKTVGIKFLSIPGAGYFDLAYTAGYETSNFPHDLKLALLEEIAWRYDNRGDGAGKSGISDIAMSYAKAHRRVPSIL